MRLIDADRFKEYCIHKLNFFPAMIARALENQPIVETITKGLYDQIKWERDVAIDQLKSYGVGLGEKADVKKVEHGKWEFGRQHGAAGYWCTNCKSGFTGENAEWIAKSHDFCGKCGAKMDGEKV